MTDEDIFAVVSPEAGAEGFCCVLGNAKQEFGMVLYLGGRCLQAHRLVQEGLLQDPTGMDLAMALEALAVTFDEKNVLERLDLGVVESEGGLILGLRLHPPFAGDEDLTATLLDAMDTAGALPSRIDVRDEETLLLFQPLAKALAVPILVSTRLPALDEAARSFEKLSERRYRGGRGRPKRV